MARRALIVGTGVADRIAAGLPGWEIERTPGAESLDLVVWADYPAAACTPHRLTDLSLAEWDEACDRPCCALRWTALGSGSLTDSDAVSQITQPTRHRGIHTSGSASFTVAVGGPVRGQLISTPLGATSWSGS